MYFSRKGLLLLVLLGALVLLTGLVYLAIDWPEGQVASFVHFMLRPVFYLFVLIGACALAWSLWRLVWRRPALRFLEDGLMVTAKGPMVGKILWQEIESARIGHVRSFEAFEIWAVDRMVLASRLPLWRRIYLYAATFPFPTLVVQIPALLLSADLAELVAAVEARKKKPTPRW